MTGQLAFSLPVVAAFRREDFCAAPSNAAALAAVLDPGVPRLLLLGPQGAGKSHLAQIWTTANEAELLPLAALPARMPTLSPHARIAIDDAGALPRDEVALFHLCNLVAGSGRLLLTATTPPRDWGLGLPDLLSRLQALPIARLGLPDDALLSAVLVKLFADRQVTVPANLIQYLVSRMERSIDAARSLVADLDASALAQARPISRSLAAELLDHQFDLPLD